MSFIFKNCNTSLTAGQAAPVMPSLSASPSPAKKANSASVAAVLLAVVIGVMGLASTGCGNQPSASSVQVYPQSQVAQADPTPSAVNSGNASVPDLLHLASASVASAASRPTGVLTFCEGTDFFDYNIETRELSDYGEADNVYRAKNRYALVKAYNNDLVLVSPDGKTRQIVVNGDAFRLFLYTRFVLSPDGKTVIFDRVSNDPRYSRALVTHNIQTSKETMKGIGGFQWPVPQDWTPDGKLLITPFSEEKAITQNGETVSINYAIFSNDLSSGEGVSIVQPGTKPVDQISDPRVDPSGKRMAFCWDNQIWIANLDGSGAKQVTESKFSDVGATGEDQPAWSPDGTWLAVDHYEGRLSSIYLVPMDGKIHTMSDKGVIKLLDKNGSGLSCKIGSRITWLKGP